ncbi:uncharacterized protein LOC117649487 [Thrips palmi]|uniref:Uncharacterized protein LOC117649487 n=1 Tax=Thrips palmi TaxID=161013 RepID=A0A6P8ZT93_THRPL|nr:uncharacterized protein LOC117649487 [Thrips palmi]
MCGDYYRTSNSVEVVKNKVLRTIDIHRNRIYSLLRHITSLAEVSARDIQDIERGAMVQRRRASSVSNQPQIINLTKELCSTASNQLNAARNLLVATSLLINHLLPN